MPRIFKGSESTLRLLIHTCNQEGKISDLKIALYTNDPSVAIEFTDRYTIDGNIVSLTVPNYAFGTMEDGVINYVAQGMIDDDTFLTERQSNYFLKTPANYTPTPMPEEVVLGVLSVMLDSNGIFKYSPEDVDAWKRARIEVNVPDTSYEEGYNKGKNDGYDSGYQDGYNQGQSECPEGGSCNLGDGSILLDTTMAGRYELFASDDGYDGWSRFIVELENGGAIKVFKASELLDTYNNGGQIDYGAYYYVGGKITEIEEINTEFGNATYVLDNGFKVYRGDWIDGNPFGEDQIKVGGYIVVYGIIQDYKGQLQFKAHSQVIAYQECEGGEIVSCNLEDKGVNPSINDRDGNGVIVITPSENYDGLLRVVLDPTTIYNEGVTAGKAEGSDLNIGAVTTSLGVGDHTGWVRSASDFGLDGITEITIDGRDYQEWTKGRTLLEAYNTTDEIHIMENGEYRPVMGYDGFAIRGYNVAWVTDVIPTIDTDVEIWVKPYDGAPNMWQGFIGSQASDDDNTTFQIRKMDGNNAFCFKFGEQTFDYEFECERWYRLRMNRRGVWVNGEQVCGWDVQAFEENPNPLMINGIYNLGFESENYRMNYAAYGYIYFHNSDSLLVPNRNGNFIGNKNRITQKLRTDDATLSGEKNYYPNGYTKVTVDVPQNGGGGEENNCELIDVNINGNGFYTTENFLPTIPMISTYGEYGVDSTGWFDLGQKMEHGDTIEIYFTFSIGDSVDQLPTLFGCEGSDWSTSTLAVRQYAGILECKIGVETVRIDVDNEFNRAHKLTINTSEGVWFDDELVVSYDFTGTWQPTDANMYVGAMNNLAEGIWRPWNSRIGNILIRKADGTEHHYEVKDGGEYRYVEGDYVIPNLKGEGVSYTAEIPYGKPADGFRSVWVEIDGEGYREEGRNDVREKLQSIDITENGRYSIEDVINVNSLRYNGGYHTDTISTYDINRIEVTFKADTSDSINGQGQPFILGGSMWGVNESGEDNECARAIQYAYGRIVGYWEGKWTDAVSCMDGEWLTITLDENGMTVKYPTYERYREYTHDNGHTNSGGDIFPFIIGGLGRRKVGENDIHSANLIEDTQFRGLIKEVKINTNSMGEITYISKNWGYGVWDRMVENTGEYLSALEPTEGEVTMNSEWERKYGEGWKEINVNIPTIQDSAKDYYYCPLILGDTGFGEAAKSWNADMVAFNNYDGDIIEDKLYVPTSNNKNEFRTKEKARFVQSLPSNVSIIGSMEFGDGVEYIRIFETKQFTNLTDLTIGPDMTTVNFGTSTFPILKRIWCFSETDSIDVYFSMGSSFYDSGTLYLKNHNQETEWKTSLPNGWTIVLL